MAKNTQKSGKTRAKKSDGIFVPPPKNLDEANRLLETIAELERGISREVADLEKHFAELRGPVIRRIGVATSEIRGSIVALHAFAKAERKSLTADGKKTVSLPAGSIGWRMRPPSVSIKNEERVLEKIKTLGLEKFVRTKEEINREAMLADKDTAASIDGVTIQQNKEEFVVKISEPNLEITDPPSKKKKAKSNKEKKDEQDSDE